MFARAAVIGLLLLSASFAALADLPLNPDVTPETIKSTVCVTNWSASVRPPASFTNAIKFAKMDAAGVPRARAAEFELDHIISIVLGGAPRDPANLRLQEWGGDEVPTPDANGLDTQAHVKDVLEVRLHKLVCSGQLGLREAQECIFNDWRACAKAHERQTP